MQDATVDQKAHILFEKYADQKYVANAMKDVEATRTAAENYGIAASVAIFGLNEVARLALRSRK